MKKAIAEKVAKLVLATAKSAAGAASDWGTYQPKEPIALKKTNK